LEYQGEVNMGYLEEDLEKIKSEHMDQAAEKLYPDSKDCFDKRTRCYVKHRLNQGEFRDQLLKRYDEKCCLCNINMEELLVASHIKPWSLNN
jgi:predicted restriction endonuclease